MEETNRIVVCLDHDDTQIQNALSKQEFEIIKLDSQNLEKAKANIEGILNNRLFSSIWIVDSQLNASTVQLASLCLRHGVDTFVGIINFDDPMRLRAMRIFHSGGICMSLDDLISEIEFSGNRESPPDHND